MREPFINVNDLILDVKSLSDLELKAYLESLSDSQVTAFLEANKNAAVTAVTASKATNYTNASNMLLGADNSVTSAAYYLLRTEDLTNLATDLNDVTSKQVKENTINKQLADRQYEINEWSNSNKLDTLFFLQVLFISLTLTAVFLFLMKNGLLPYYLFGLFSFLTVAFAVIVLIYRARFTAVKRDGRYWNKQKWGQPSK
uniref:Uncharacterized protein n=1 Tax=viral metagenome TaxID=1070528 RepID=A0A6C0KBI9_9ZZZZ